MHKVKSNILLIILGIFLALLIVEGLLKLLGWGYLYLQERQNTRSLLNLDQKLAQTNIVKSDLVNKEKIIIICLGESTTQMGGGSTSTLVAEYSWPRQLETIINNIQNKRNYRVINKGLAGRDTTWMLSSLPNWLNEYKPHFVLAMAGINDREDMINDREDIIRTAFFTNLRTYKLIKWIVAGFNAQITGQNYNPTTMPFDVKNNEKRIYGLENVNVTDLYPRTLQHLNGMVNLTIDYGANFVFVQYAGRKIDVLRKDINNKKAHYISNYEIFSEILEKYDYHYIFVDDFGGNFGHTTILGNRLIADNVARNIIKIVDDIDKDN